MKKYFFSFTAFILAIVLCSFSSKKPEAVKSQTALYWFEVEQGMGDANKLSDADVTYLNSFSETPPTGNCSGLQTYNCVVGFAPGKVSTSPTVHLISGDHDIDGFGDKRSSE